MQSTLPSVTIVVEGARRFVDQDTKDTPTIVDRIKAELGSQHTATIRYAERALSHKHLWEQITSIDTQYAIFIKEGHNWSARLFPNLIQTARATGAKLVEPYTFTTTLPNNPSWAARQTEYDYYRDLSIYGKLFDVDELRKLRAITTRIDKSTLYLTYRLYWNILHTQPTGEAYTSNNPMINSSGMKLRGSENQILPIATDSSLELRRGILRLLILALRRLRQRSKGNLSLEEMGRLIKHYNLTPLIELAKQHHPIESMWVQTLANPDSTEHLTKVLTDHDLYTRISTSPLELSPPSALINTVRTRDASTCIYREYRPKSLRNRSSSPREYDFYRRPITNRSTILLFDRPTEADDNAEHLYRFIAEKMPDYTNLYFALNESSPDWNRLLKQGFNLVNFYSPKFDQILLESDVVISSQLMNINRFGKDFSNSRFVYLQHGIQLNDMTAWLASNYFDLIVSTGEMETQYLRTIAPVETLASGMPRLQSLRKKDVRSNQISYMPTWNFKDHGLSDDDFSKTRTAKQINELLHNERLRQYLRSTETVLKIKLHPNLQGKSKSFHTSSDIQISYENYQNIIENSEFVFSDYSSVALDAAFAGVPIAFYQQDSEDFYRSQVYNRRLNYEALGLGPVFTKVEAIVSYIINEAYKFDRVAYKASIDSFFGTVDRKDICQAIIRRVIKL